MVRSHLLVINRAELKYSREISVPGMKNREASMLLAIGMRS